jgi:hypothetical protein
MNNQTHDNAFELDGSLELLCEEFELMEVAQDCVQLQAFY